MGKERLRKAIEYLANTTFMRAQTATTEQERQEAIDQAAGIERLAAQELGNAWADANLPWNAARQAAQ